MSRQANSSQPTRVSRNQRRVLRPIRIEVAGKGQLTIAGYDEQALRMVLECWLR